MKQIPQKVDIPNYEGLYYITIDGEIFRYGKSKPLKPILSQHGYTVFLSKDNKVEQLRINNIMRDCYFGGTKLPIKHLTEMSDFSYWNLRPMSRAEIAKETGRKNSKAIVRIYKNEVEIYESIKDCAEKNEFHPNTIRKYCKGLVKETLDGAKYYFEEDYYRRFGDEYSCN